MDVIEVRLVAHFAVVECGVVDTGMYLQSARQLYLTAESADLVVAREIGVTHVARVEVLRHLYVCPVVGFATLRFELRNLCAR